MILFYDLMPSSKVTSIGPSTQIILVYDTSSRVHKNLMYKKVTESTAQCLKITQNVALMNFWSVNVARFARNFEYDYLCDFQTRN